MVEDGVSRMMLRVIAGRMRHLQCRILVDFARGLWYVTGGSEALIGSANVGGRRSVLML
jgi:hypothetical protein